jgi:hypothetical protein
MRPAESFYERAEANDAAVWRACEYRREECDRCPAWRDEPGHGRCKQGCRALAEEMIAVSLEAMGYE